LIFERATEPISMKPKIISSHYLKHFDIEYTRLLFCRLKANISFLVRIKKVA